MSDKNVYESLRDDVKKLGGKAFWILLIIGIFALFYISMVFVIIIVLLALTGLSALIYFVWARESFVSRFRNRIEQLQFDLTKIDELIRQRNSEVEKVDSSDLTIIQSDLRNLYQEKSTIENNIQEAAKRLANFFADNLNSLNSRRDRLLKQLSKNNSDETQNKLDLNKDKIVTIMNKLRDLHISFNVEPDEDGSPARGASKYPMLKHFGEFAQELFESIPLSKKR